MEDIRDRVAEILIPHKFYDNVSNRLSTGGPMERSMKKRVGDMAHGKEADNFLERCYGVIQNTYEKMNNNASKVLTGEEE